MKRTFRIACIVAAMLGAGATALQAQAVRGVVSDSATAAPVQEFTIELVDAQGARVAAALSKAGGTFFLRAPTAGEYRLRVLRIGYRRTMSPPFVLHDGELLPHAIAIPQIPTRLASMRAEANRECRLQDGDGSAIADVWEEVRKAVQAVQLSDQDAPLVMAVHDYSRAMDLRGDSTRAETDSIRYGTSARPYLSPSPEDVGEHGYVQVDGFRVIYYAPDAAILGSDIFLRSHCFRLANDELADGTLIGIAFEPTRRHEPPDIRGTVWLDRATARLRSLDYTYTALPRWAEGVSFGGHVDFQHVDGGAWIIRAWRVRAPLMHIGVRQQTSGLGARGIGMIRQVPDTVLTGVNEVGGDVLAARASTGTLLWASALSAVRGTLRDSSNQRPLAGAEVTLRGTTHRTTTDDAGRFVLEGIPTGRYTIVVTKTSTDAPPVLSSRQITVSHPVEASDLSLAASAAASAWAARVRERAEGSCIALRAQREREIAATWATPVAAWHPSGADSSQTADAIRGASTLLQAVADTMGNVDMTSVRILRRGPAATYVAATDFLGALHPAVEEPVPGCKVRRTILLPYRVRTGAGADAAIPRATLNAGQIGTGGTAGALDGRVRDLSGLPIRGATVEALGAGTATADSNGAFVLRLAPGGYLIRARALGYEPAAQRVVLGEAGRLTLDFALPVFMAQLEGVVVRADSARPLAHTGFEERRRTGQGKYVTEEDIRDRRAVSTTSLLQMTIGALVEPNGNIVLEKSHSSFMKEQMCRGALVIVDAVPMPIPFDINSIAPSEIGGIEVYRTAASVPPQFQSLRTNCGTIVVWTK